MEVFSSRPGFTCQPWVRVQGAAVPSYICLCVWRGRPKEWGAVEGWNGFVSVAPSTRILMRIKWGRLISPSAWPEVDVHVWILFPSTQFVWWSNLSEQELSRDLSLSLEKGMATHSSDLAWRIPMYRGAWQAVVHGVANSWTLSD